MKKPGDHPEFFRFPAPAGRSRESTIVLDRNGRFWHEGARIENARMARAFFRWLRRHPDDGRYILSNDYDWTYISVEDAPFFVDALHFDDEAVLVILSDDSREPLDVRGVRVGVDSALYVRVKGGAFEARFRQSAQTALAPLLSEGSDGSIVLSAGGRTIRIS